MKRLFFILITLSNLIATAQEVPEARSVSIKNLEKKLESSLERLDQQRAKESAERTQLGKKVTTLETELLNKRRKRSIARLSSEGRKELIRSLERKKYTFDKDASYIGGLYRDFAVQLENNLQLGQSTLYQAPINAAIEGSSSLIEQSEVIDAALNRLESVIGGEEISAEVVTETGLIINGKAINIGPASWFYSTENGIAGAVFHENQGSEPLILNEESESVMQLFKDGYANLAIDITGGKARAIDRIQSDSGRLFEKGGTWIWVILTVAAVAAACGIIKFIQLLNIKDPKDGWIGDILVAVKANKLEDALRLAKQVSHPVGPLMCNAIEYSKQGADVVEEVVYEQLIHVQSQLQKWLPFIAVTAATAPLLGLLGTVSGMIRMFNVITVTGTGDIKPMAGGISEALITTLFGLIVAIPALILHTMLSRKSNGIVQNTEKLGLSFVNGLRKS